MGRLWMLPGARRIRRSGFLNHWLRIGYGPHWGYFPTRAAALGFLRPAQRTDYDNDEIAKINLDLFKRVHGFDWPILFFLQTMSRQGTLKVVTDFGGHVGVKYQAYRTLMTFPPGLLWQVVDVPAVCRAGREQGHESPGLSYHETLSETVPCDVLLCSGSLQYADRSLEEIVTALPRRPSMILINKVAVAAEDFFTLESFGIGRLPYQVISETRLGAMRDALGYALTARWDMPARDFVVPHRRGVQAVTMVGEAWTQITEVAR